MEYMEEYVSIQVNISLHYYLNANTLYSGMKKRILLLPVITLLLGGLAFFAKPKAESVSAADAGAYHLFVQIEKESDLREGDTVFFGTPGGTVFSALSGNPVFASEAHPSGRSEDGKKYYTYYTESYQDMLLMRAEPGAYSGTWSFKSLRSSKQEENYAHPTRGRYLAYGHNYSDKKYTNINAYGDVNMADGKGQYTSWSLEFRGEEKYAIMKYYGEEYDTHIQWVYYGSTARNNFGYYTGNTDIYLYKEITVDQGTGRVSLDMFSHPDQTTVYEGDYLDLTGLEMRITIDKGEDNELSFTSSYEIDHGFYTVTYAAKNATHVYCTYASWTFNIEVEVIEDTSGDIYFNKVKTLKGDYRGSYVIVYENGSQIYQLTSKGGSLEYTKANADDPICDNLNSSITGNMFSLIHKRIDGVTYMFMQAYSSGKYVVRTEDSIDFTYYEEDLTANDAVTIDEDLNIHIGDGILYFNDYPFDVGPNPDESVRAKLYKKVIDYTAINQESTARFDSFISNFASVTGSNCDASGDTETSLTTTQWNTLKSKFDDIANDICGYDFQGYLANTTYVHNQEAGSNSVKDLMDRYDFILSRYQDSKGYDDFIDRKLGNAYQSNYVTPSNDLINVNEQIHSNETSMIVIAVMLTVSVASLTVLLVIKKRRQ